MDQGFNDDELADIMNEIESLEQEFTEETQEDEFEAKGEDASQDEEDEVQARPEQPHAQTEIVEKLSQKDEQEIEQAHHQAHDDQNVHAIKQKPTHSHDQDHWAPASMDFSIEGDMKMNMFFRISGKTVHLHVNEGAFEIELEGGMKFSIPVHEQSGKKAA